MNISCKSFLIYMLKNFLCNMIFERNYKEEFWFAIITFDVPWINEKKYLEYVGNLLEF